MFEDLKRMMFFSRLLRTLVFVIAAFTFAAIFSPRASVIDHLITDDGFYALTIARNLSLGKGITIDGTNLTNGFQPLFVFLCVPFFIIAGEDRILALRLVLALHWVFYLATAFVIGSIASHSIIENSREKKALISWLAMFIYLSNYIVYSHCFNGLETGCLLFFLSVLWRFFQGRDLKTWREIFLLGLVLGFLVLVRIDTVFLIGVVFFYLILAKEGLSLISRIKRSLFLVAIVAFISSIWWAYNLSYFGSLMPTSGRAQQAWILSFERIKNAFIALTTDLIPIAPLPAHAQFKGITWIRISLLSLSAFLMWKKRRVIQTFLFRDKFIRRTTKFSILYLISILALGVWYTFSSFATWHYLRYFSPILLVYALIATSVIYGIIHKFPKLICIVLMLMSLTIPFGVFRLYASSDATLNRVLSKYGRVEFSSQLKLVENWVPEGELVSAGQSGTLGYLRDYVINLDGKVNHEVLQYHPWDSQNNEVWIYLERREIKWFCDWSVFGKLYLGEKPERHGWKLIGQLNDFVLYHRL